MPVDRSGGAKRVRDHWWWRPGWHVGRRAYTFHITFDDEAAVEGLDELHRLATDYQRVLATLPGLDMVPLQWLHLTMQNVGFTDEVSESEAAAVLDEARRRCASLQAFELVMDEAEVRSEGVALRPHPADPVCQVRDAVRAAIGSIRDEVPEAPEHAHGFEPHVSLAYSNSEAPSEPVSDAIDRVSAGVAKLKVRAAKLIVLDRDERVYRWTTFGDVTLRPS
jgi:2'-5' RNA ligase